MEFALTESAYRISDSQTTDRILLLGFPLCIQSLNKDYIPGGDTLYYNDKKLYTSKT